MTNSKAVIESHHPDFLWDPQAQDVLGISAIKRLVPVFAEYIEIRQTRVTGGHGLHCFSNPKMRDFGKVLGGRELRQEAAYETNGEKLQFFFFLRKLKNKWMTAYLKSHLHLFTEILA